MSKAQIVQRLLDEKQISAEEAVVLLSEKGEVYHLPYTPMDWEVAKRYDSPYAPPYIIT